MIYNESGALLKTPFDVDGNLIDAAYDVGGENVFSNPYKYYEIEDVFNKSRDNAQGIDIYNNYMVIYRDDTYSLQFVNMTTWLIDYVIPTGLTSHGNDITFSDIFYDENDDFPLLFVANKSSPGLRVNTSTLTSTVVKTITATPTGETWVVYATAFNDDMSRYYCIGYNTNNYSDTSGFIFLETWDISNDLENPTRISSITRPWFPCIQGMAYHDGLLWVASGMGDPVKVFAISPLDASIVKTVDLTQYGELEGISWGFDNGTEKWFCVYGQIINGVTYFRIDFSPTPIA